jgi:hypothetical protein
MCPLPHISPCPAQRQGRSYGGSELQGCYRRQSPRGNKINILNERFGFSALKKYLITEPMKRNSISNYDCLKFILSVRGGYGDYSPLEQKKPFLGHCIGAISVVYLAMQNDNVVA